MSLCIVDTETSGLPLWDKPYSDPGQPRIVQLGVIVADEHGAERACFKTTIRPEGWEITAGAQRVHGISTEDANRFGIPVLEALAVFLRMLDQSRTLIAHNLAFDADIMISREIHALSPNKADTPSWWGRGRLHRACTMLLGRAHCRNTGKLVDVYKALTGEDFVQTHDGLDDARAALRCFLALRAAGAAGVEIPARRSQL